MSWMPGRKTPEKPKRVRDNLKVSPNEERYLLAETLTGRVYVVPAATRIYGAWDAEKIEEILQAICDRHEARRTGFERNADGVFTKYVEERANVVIKQLYMPGATREQIRQAINDYCYEPGDFSPTALQRYMMIHLGENDFVFVFGHHHATSDGVSMQAFSMELAARAFGGQIDEAPSQYNDHWSWDWANSDAYKTAEAFWTGRLGGLDDVGSWPEDRAGGSGERARLGVSVVLTPELVASTQAAAAAIGVTHFSYFYAAYLVLLARMTGSDTVCTTFQSAGRRGMSGAEGAHGVFSNALILATRVDERESISTLSARLKAEVREAIAHEIFPYHHVIRATGVRARYAINWYPQMPPVNVGDLKFEPMRFDENQDDDDLNLRFVTYMNQTELFVFYNPDAFSRERVLAATRQLAALAGELARDVNRPVGEVLSVDLAGPGLLPDSTAPLPSGEGGLIQSAFLARAAETPAAIAIEDGAGKWTYGELEARSRALAQHLRAAGVQPGDRVAVLAARGAGFALSLLATTRMGAVFALLDPAYPLEPLEALVAVAAPKAILHAGDPGLAPIAQTLAAKRQLVVLDAEGAVADSAGIDGLEAADPDAAAYILFTSGSLGHPKGVAASHRPLSRFVAWQAKTYGLTAADRVTLLSGLAHDPVLRDVFTPLSIGAAIVIPDARTIAEPGALAPWFAKARATVAHLTPAMGLVLAGGAKRARRLPDLRRIFWGGDLLSPDAIAEVERLAPTALHTNFYGATETPQAAAAFDWDGDSGGLSISIGRGVAGAQLILVDTARRPVGIGEVGEIAVRSSYLSLGYVHQGRIAADEDRGCDPAGAANIYYTGDRGIYLPGGEVLALGRADDQVKVRGHRVELSEVTAALLAHPDVRTAVALAVGEGAGRRIAAFVVGQRQGGVREPELRAFLAARLPNYMAPQTIRLLGEMPLLASGKVDRRALLALGDVEARATPAPAGRAANAAERGLIAQWSEILGVPGISFMRDSTFASLGGDSLSYVQIYLATEEIVGEAPAGWQILTIAELAATQRKANPFWSVIDMPILLRAVAIVLVVVGHFNQVKYSGAATSALMIVSGFMFGTLPLREAFAKQSPAPVLRTLWNILLPTAALSAFIWLARLHGQAPSLSILLFTADLQDQTRSGHGQEFYLWFIHCLLHIFILLYLAISAVKAAKAFRIGERQFLLGLFVIGYIGRFLLPQLIDPTFLSHAPEAIRRVAFLPTTHFATVVLGALIATSRDARERLGLAAVVVAYSGLSAWLYGPNHGGYILVSGLLLLGLPRVSLPRVSTSVVFTLAGASLWIYLTHMLLRDGLNRLGWIPLPGLRVALALGGGVLLWTLWNRGVALTRLWTRRPASQTADATV